MAKIPKKRGEATDMVDAFLPKRIKQEDLEVTGVSRSGRVRKKSSKLTDFESPDEIDNRYKRRTDRADTPGLTDSSGGLATHHVMGGGRGRKPHGAGGGTVMERAHQDDMADDFVTKSEPPDSESDSELGMYPEGVDEDSSMDSMGSDEDDDMDEDGLMMNDQADGRVAGRRDSQDNTPSQAQSLYMLEKSSKKKLIIRDGKIVGRMKAQRKDKGKTRFTAYMLWAKEIRQEILRVNPDMDFATMSKRLGELWATVPNNEKYNWKRRAKRLAVKGNREAPTATDAARWKAPPSRSKFINKQASRSQGQATNSQNESVALPTSIAGGGRQHVRQQVVTQTSNQNMTANLTVSPPENTKSNKVTSGILSEPVVGPGLYKVVGSQPVDVAAHLKLLGESLSIIGERLKEHEGQFAVSGSLSVLLDSLLCALGPLLCLTQQVPETNGCSPEMLSKILDNIAYFMPGL
ncbi:HMG domain-containing protein 4 [Gryllus bimaculatus]|nr:HMG domain-containing protein 4 [Gryllus bimaculatus]